MQRVIMFKFGFYPPSSNEEQQQEQQSAVANEDTAVTDPDQYAARRIRHVGDGGKSDLEYMILYMIHDGVRHFAVFMG